MNLIGNLKLRKKQAVLGLFAAWQLTVAFVAFVPLFAATPVEAQKPVTCFMRVECLDGNVKGNCDKQHCFEPRKECADGQGLCYANPPAVPLVIAVGGHNQVIDLSDYIAIVFNFGAIAAGSVATVMFMIGGFQYLTAGGDSGRVSAGKKRIVDALVGLMLVLGSVIMLRTVNPDILKLQMPKIEIVKKKPFVGCDLFSLQAKCGDPFVIVQIPGSTESMPIEKQFQVGTADDFKQKKGIICRGTSCGMAGLDDGTYRCVKDKTSSAMPADAPTQCGGAPAAPYMCKLCAGWGGGCSQQGKSDDCCTGFCGTRSTALATKDVVGTVSPGAGLVTGGGLPAAIGNGLCTNGEAGVNCDGNGECKTGRCQTRGFHTCSSGLTGAACDDASQCASGYACPQITGMFICTPKVPGSYCLTSADCAEGYECPKLNGGILTAAADAASGAPGAVASSCQTKVAKAQKECDEASAGWEVDNTECNAQLKEHWVIAKTPAGLLLPGCRDLVAIAAKKTAYCGGMADLKLKCFGVGVAAGALATATQKADDQFTKYEIMERCRPAGNPTNCTSGSCPNGMNCVKTDNDQSVCTTGEDGSPCLNDSNCTDHHCIAAVTSFKGLITNSGKPGLCSKGLVGERCSKGTECQSGHCYVGDTISATRGALQEVGSLGEAPYGFCTSGQAGSGCNPDAKAGACDDGYECSDKSHSCVVTAKKACS